MKQIYLLLILSTATPLLAIETWTKDFRKKLLQNDRSEEATVTITEVPSDNNCGFHATRITREEFYEVLRRVAPIRDAILAPFRNRRDRELLGQMEQWFHRAEHDRDTRHWLNTAGIILMANLYGFTITTYAYRFTRGICSYTGTTFNDEDTTTIVRTAVYTPLPELREFANFVTERQVEDVGLLNAGGTHWQRIVVPVGFFEQPGPRVVLNVESDEEDFLEPAAAINPALPEREVLEINWEEEEEVDARPKKKERAAPKKRERKERAPKEKKPPKRLRDDAQQIQVVVQPPVVPQAVVQAQGHGVMQWLYGIPALALSLFWNRHSHK